MQSKRNAPSAMVARQSLKDEELVSHLSLRFKLQLLFGFFFVLADIFHFVKEKRFDLILLRLKLDKNNNIQLKK